MILAKKMMTSVAVLHVCVLQLSELPCVPLDLPRGLRSGQGKLEHFVLVN